jgi:predicted GTPase
MAERRRVVILGAAGRDFHDFNVVFRKDPSAEVVAFTAAQIPGIAERRYPPDLAGPLYPEGIPIRPEADLERLIDDRRVDEVVFSYSDLAHADVLHLAARAVSRGASFRLLGGRATMLRSSRPVISVCAVRTGSGKSPVARRVAAILRDLGRRVAVVRHPMPYGDLSRQAVQRFASLDDLARADCTIEEREEYEPHVARGNVVFAGVDYERVLRLAEREADVVIWDGGNNDTSFFAPDLEIVVLDPHRAGDERATWPGEVNFLRADVFVLNKLDTAEPARVDALRATLKRHRPDVRVIDAEMPLRVENEALLRGRRALVIEDGPTVTHGGLPFGAGALAAARAGAEAVDPRPAAVGSLRETFARFPHLERVLPAMGYGEEQRRELEATIRAAACDVVVIATPVDLRRILRIDRPACRVDYDIRELGRPNLEDVVKEFLSRG